MSEFLRILGDFGPLGGIEVIDHAVVEWEERGGSTNFGTHVTNGSHTSAREGFDTGTIVFDNSTRSTLDGEDTSDLENDV